MLRLHWTENNGHGAEEPVRRLLVPKESPDSGEDGRAHRTYSGGGREVRAMRNIWGRRGVAAVVILVLVLCLTLLAFSATAGAKTKARPFHGCMFGTVTFVPNADSPTGMFTISDATGPVSHMGASVLYAIHPSAFDFAGDMTLTAANGDTIAISYYGGGALPPSIGDWYDLWTVARSSAAPAGLPTYPATSTWSCRCSTWASERRSGRPSSSSPARSGTDPRGRPDLGAEEARHS
jgi:hypothetical protein